MKLKAAALTTIFVLITACASGPSSDGGNEVSSIRITADSIGDYFNKRIFFIDGDGKEQRENYIVLRAGGTVEGAWKNQPLVATWEMRDDYWCRILVEFHNADRIGSEDCQLWEQEGNVIRATRDRGAGVSWTQGIGEEDITQ